MENKKIIYILILLVILGLLLIGSIILVSMGGSRSRSKDARVQADMAQIRSVAEMIYSDQWSYENLSCQYKGLYEEETSLLCADIEENSGSKPILHASKDKYCGYSKMPSYDTYLCIEGTGVARQTYINPGGLGYCDGRTFLCPMEMGTPPPQRIIKDWFPAFLSFIFTAGIISGFGISIRKYFKKGERPPRREENWTSVKEEVRANKWFYVWTGLLIFSPIIFIISFFLTIIPSLIFWKIGEPEPPSFISLILIALTFILTYLPLLIVFIASIGLIFQIKLVKKTLKEETSILPWEGYAAPISFGIITLYFIGLIIISILAENLFKLKSDTIFNVGAIGILFIVGLGISFIISSILQKGKLNKVIGIAMLLIILGFGFLAFMALGGAR